VLPFDTTAKVEPGSSRALQTAILEGDEMAKKATAKKSARKPNAAFMKPMTPSSSLAEVVGTKPIPRTEVTKKLWAYIKKNGLQDKKNKRMIKADDALKPVFGGKAQVNMFEMTKLVNKHLKA
jgi:chromatin remodeling complex protein RSC6